MMTPHYQCDDCGYAFEKSELFPDFEDGLMACPVCGSTELELAETPAEEKKAA